MGRNLTILLASYDGGGSPPARSGTLYLRPTRMDALFKFGASWYPWELSPLVANTVLAQGGFIPGVAVAGTVTFQGVPFTDTEVQLPLDPSGTPIGAACEWQILDEQAPGGPRLWQGSLPSSLGTGTSNLVDLLTLAGAPWRSIGALIAAEPREDGSFAVAVGFGPGVDEMTVGWPFVLLAPPSSITFGSTTDQSGAVFVAAVKADPVTGAPMLSTTQMTVKLSGAPGSTVTVWARIAP